MFFHLFHMDKLLLWYNQMYFIIKSFTLWSETYTGCPISVLQRRENYIMKTDLIALLKYVSAEISHFIISTSLELQFLSYYNVQSQCSSYHNVQSQCSSYYNVQSQCRTTAILLAWIPLIIDYYTAVTSSAGTGQCMYSSDIKCRDRAVHVFSKLPNNIFPPWGRKLVSFLFLFFGCILTRNGSQAVLFLFMIGKYFLVRECQLVSFPFFPT